MRARPVVAHRLADLVRGELADHVGSEDERDGERGQAREHRAQRDVVEDVEEAHVLGQPLRELEQHQCPPWAMPVSAATTRSIFMKRDPLTRMLLPWTFETSSSSESKCRAPSPNAATACRLASPIAYSLSMFFEEA